MLENEVVTYKYNIYKNSRRQCCVVEKSVWKKLNYVQFNVFELLS